MIGVFEDKDVVVRDGHFEGYCFALVLRFYCWGVIDLVSVWSYSNGFVDSGFLGCDEAAFARKCAVAVFGPGFVDDTVWCGLVPDANEPV